MSAGIYVKESMDEALILGRSRYRGM